MSFPTIQFDQAGIPAGSPRVSRSDGLLGTTVFPTDPANGAGTHLWELIARPIGSGATLTGAATATPSFTPDVPGTYLIKRTWNAEVSGADDAIGQFITDQGAFRVLMPNGTLIPGAGETNQLDTDVAFGVVGEGWHPGRDEALRAVDQMRNPIGDTHGSVLFVATDGTYASVAPATPGQILTTSGPGSDPTWVDPGVISAPAGSGAGGTITLGDAYTAGQSIITTALGPVALSRVLADTVETLTVDKSPATGTWAGSAISVSSGTRMSGPTLLVTRSRTSGETISADADTDATFLFGRSKIWSPTGDEAHWGHIDMGGTDTAIEQDQTGATILRAKTATAVAFQIGTASQFKIDTSTGGLSAAIANGPVMLNEASTAINPVFCPIKSSRTTGVGGPAGTIDMIVASTSALLLDANRDARFAGSAYLGERASAGGDVTGYGQIWAKTSDELWFTGPGGSDVRLGVGVTTLSVADITDPSTELNAIAGAFNGDIRLCSQTLATGDERTLYVWDNADSDPEAVPYSVDGSSGRWQALAGRYNWNGIDTPGEIVAFAGSVKAIDLGKTTIENASTGALKFDGLSIGAPATEVDIGAGEGHLIDNHTDPDNPTHTDVSWGAQSLTITDLADQVFTWVYIDSSGTPQQQTTKPTPLELRENLHLGFMIAFGGILIALAQAPYVAINPGAQLSGLFDAIGTINLSISISNGGTNLTLANSGGTLVARGINFDGTPAGRANPNEASVPSANPAPFRYGTQNNFDPAFVTDVDPANYDVGGTITPIPGSNNRATNQRIWIAPDGALALQYGSVWYDSVTAAISGSSTEAFINHPSFAANNSVLLATMSIRKGATNLSLDTDVRFLPGSKFGESSIGGAGQSVTNIQQAYNNSMDGTILTDTTRTAVKFQRGTAADTDDVLEVLNGAGAQTWGVTGLGYQLAPLGVEATPSVAVGAVGDGMWSPGTGQVAFSTGATQALLLDASQNATFAGTVSTTGLVMGGHTITDVLISSDGASTSDTVFVTPGWIDSNVGGGGLTALSVANIDDPSTELNAITGAAKGDTRLVYQTVAGKDEWVIYAWDNADSDGESVPHTVDGSAGMWSAIGGKYNSGVVNSASGFSGPVGAAATPTYAFEGTTLGMYRSGSAIIRFALSSSYTLQISGTSISQRYTNSTTVPRFSSALALETGVGWPADDECSIITASTEAVRWDASQNQINAGNITMSDAAGPAIQNEASTAVNPTFAPIKTDLLSGLGGIASTPSMITASVERQRWTANGVGVPVSTIFRDAVGADSLADDIGLRLANTTAAIADVSPPDGQQYSPMLEFEGQGWKTDATAATQEVLMAMQLETVQGAANPSGELVVRSNINAAGYTEVLRLASNGQMFGVAGSLSFPTYSFDSYRTTGIFAAAAESLRITIEGVQKYLFNDDFFQTVLGGTPATPVVRISDAGVGLYRASENTLGIATAAVAAALWDASQVMTAYSHVNPDVDSANDLGLTGTRWRELFVDDITLTTAINIGGALNHDGSTAGFFTATPVVQPTAYTLNATVVTSKTLLASASATIVNNNNVIAQLVTDLQALGLVA